MTLHQYLLILRKRWQTLFFTTLACLLVAMSLTLAAEKVYSATATAFVSLASGSQTPDSLYQNSQFALSRVQSYPEVVHNPDVLQSVVDDLQLDMTIGQLDAMVSATNPVDTVLIQVTAKDSSPAQAQAIANDLTKQLGVKIEQLEESTSNGLAPVKVSVAVPAKLSAAPISPRPLLNIALGLLVGLALGAVLSVLREQFDTTLKSGRELAEISGLSPLGSIRFSPAYRSHPLVTTQADSSGLEDFRTLRTTLQFVNVDSPPRQIVVSSAIASEGKSTVACNLAITLAQTDVRVCLVEGDLRRSKLNALLGINGSLGLSDVVASHFALDDVLVEWNHGQLTVLPAGTAPPDPGKLLGSRAMQDLLAELRKRFDYIIIDTPPLLPVSDGVLLGSVSDGVILVARQRHVRRDQVRNAVEILEAAGVTMLGSVVTHVPRKESTVNYGADYVQHGELAPATPEQASESPMNATAAARSPIGRKGASARLDQRSTDPETKPPTDDAGQQP